MRTLWTRTEKLVELTGSDAPLPVVLTEVVNTAVLGTSLTSLQAYVAAAGVRPPGSDQ